MENNFEMKLPEENNSSGDISSVETVKKNSKLPLIVGFVFLLLAGFTAVFFYLTQVKDEVGSGGAYGITEGGDTSLGELYSNEVGPVSSEGDENFGITGGRVTEELGGVIIFSSRKPTPVTPDIQIHALDILSTNGSGVVNLIPDYFTSAMASFIDVFNPADFYLLAMSNTSSEQDPDKRAIHHYKAGKGIKPLYETFGEAERNLDVSTDGRFVTFNRKITESDSYTDSVYINNWESAVLDTESGELVAVIPHSWSPELVDNGQYLVYLKKDGLFSYDMSTGLESPLVRVSDGQVNATGMLDVSNDDSQLLWTTAKRGLITLFNLTTDAEAEFDKVSVKAIGQISEEGSEFYAPKFSPGGEYYVVQAIDVLKGDDFLRKNPRLEIRAITGRGVVMSHDISDFWFDSFFTDQWLAKMPNLN